ncbi:MAG: pyruvate kinase [Candidatus Micrarchaeia archaeon]
MIKSKIIATYGPSLAEEAILKEVIKRADVIRINFAHTSAEDAKVIADKIKNLASMLGKEIGILGDLPGPKIRLGNIENILVKKGDLIKFTGPEGPSDAIEIEYNNLAKDIKAGTVFSIGEGALKFKVKHVNRSIIVCKALSDGYLSSHKGVNFYNTEISESPPTKEDISFANFAVKSGFDFVAESFVKSPEDIEALRSNVGNFPIIAKIERKKAVKAIRNIAASADAVMVARGDLAFEVSIESIPIVQRKIIEAARQEGKPVIVATQALASMVDNEVPTRAEVNDIAAAITEGADAILLSDETAIGKYPIKALETLRKSISFAERLGSYEAKAQIKSAMDYVAYAAADIANRYKLDCIFAPTKTGNTARRLSMLRPNTKIFALSKDEKVLRKLSIYKGINTLLLDQYMPEEKLFVYINKIAQKIKAKKYIVVYGSTKAGSTDTLKYVEL